MTSTDSVMKYIVGISAAAAISLSGWNLLSTVGHESRIGVVEERSFNQKDALQRIESKLDRLIEREISHGTSSAASRRRPVPDARSTFGGP